MKDHYRNIQPVVQYNPNGRNGPPVDTKEPVKIEVDTEIPAEPPEPVLRGSLANSVSIDLTNEAPAKVTRTITRI